MDELLDTAEIVVCCGSGGVGKTTTAAALAVRAAERGRKTVVLTIDPARRLAQSMGLSELDNTPREVAGVDGQLDAMMLDMKRTFDEIVLAHASPEKAEQILANPFYQALSSSFAGTQEYMAMEKLGQLKSTGAYDLIVVDTPPSRSALDFLDAPERLSSFLDGRFVRLLLTPARGPAKLMTAGFSLITNALTRILGAQFLKDLHDKTRIDRTILDHLLHQTFADAGDRAELQLVGRPVQPRKLPEDRRTVVLVGGAQVRQEPGLERLIQGLALSECDAALVRQRFVVDFAQVLREPALLCVVSRVRELLEEHLLGAVVVPGGPVERERGFVLHTADYKAGVSTVPVTSGIAMTATREVLEAMADETLRPRKSVLAAQKLVNQDKVFIVAGHIGTAPNMAAMPVQFAKNIVNFMPITAAREMYEPFNRLKYSFAATYYDQIRLALPKMIKDKGAKRVCTIYQDDEFGLEVQRGAEAGLKAANMELVEKTSFKRGATDFSSQVAKMKAANCDLVVLGTIIRETIGTVGEARKTGFNPTFLGSSAAYTDLIHKLGGKAMDGIYATMTVQNPYTDEQSQPIRFWANKYKTKFNEDPTVFSVYGYSIIQSFAKAAEKTGANLSTDSFIKVMDSMTFEPDMFGSAKATYTATKRLGSDLSRLSQIQDGKWKVVSDYVAP